jgi:N-acetylneuraminic acid mutarotase
MTVTTHEVYDPATNTWMPAPPLPVARDHLSVVVLDGKIHVIGGRTNNNTTDNTNLHDVYDPKTNSWSTAATMPTARSATAAAVVKGMIVVAGGECDHGHTFTQAEAYDSKSDRWTTLTPIVGRHGFGAAAIGATAYFVGGNKGCGGGDTTDDVLALKLP